MINSLDKEQMPNKWKTELKKIELLFSVDTMGFDWSFSYGLPLFMGSSFLFPQSRTIIRSLPSLSFSRASIL